MTRSFRLGGFRGAAAGGAEGFAGDRVQKRPLRLCRPGKMGDPRCLNFNIYNFPLHSAGCFGEAEKDLRKTIRQAEKITRHLRKTTKHLEKIIRQVVAPSPALFFGPSGQRETEEAPVWWGVLGLANANIQHFWAKSKSAQLRFNISPVPPT